jgi:hypothetical protein
VIGLDQRCDVWKRGAGGRYDVPGPKGVACRLTSISTRGAGSARAELAATRRLLWGPNDTIEEGSRIEVDGETWQTQRGTFAKLRGPNSAVVYQRCDCTRAEN